MVRRAEIVIGKGKSAYVCIYIHMLINEMKGHGTCVIILIHIGRERVAAVTRASIQGAHGSM